MTTYANQITRPAQMHPMVEKARSNMERAAMYTVPEGFGETQKITWDPDANTPNTRYMSPKVDVYYFERERRMGIGISLMGYFLIMASLVMGGMIAHRAWVDGDHGESGDHHAYHHLVCYDRAGNPIADPNASFETIKECR